MKLRLAAVALIIATTVSCTASRPPAASPAPEGTAPRPAATPWTPTVAANTTPVSPTVTPAVPPAASAAPVTSTATALLPFALPHSAYPDSPRGTVVDTYHGVQVADPYRWLEDTDSAATTAWVAAQNRLTRSLLDSAPGRDAIRARLDRLWDYERFSVPNVRGKRLFFTRNSGLQPQSVWYVVDDDRSEPRVLLDPNTLSTDGTVAIAGTSFSDDGRLMAYAIAGAGSDWQDWHVRDVATGRDLPDILRWTKFTSPEWLPDASGFFYGRFDEPPAGAERTATNYFQKLCLHRLGTAQATDAIVYERTDHKDWQFSPTVSDDGRWLVITVSVGTDRRSMVFLRDLTDGAAKVVELLPDFDAEYRFLGNDGTLFYFRTDLAAPRGRVIAIDLRHPEHAAWRTVVPEAPEALVGVSLIGNTFIASYLKDAASEVKLIALDGTAGGRVTLPGLGSSRGFDGLRHARATYFSFTSFLNPATIYRLDLPDGAVSGFRAPKLAFEPTSFVTERVFVPSKDGTRVPMFLSHRKGLVHTSTTPVLLYAYGGFNISLTPSFSVANLAWMEMGGVAATACLRGGGEYGERWHAAGMLENKQNVFDDFIAAGEWLVANGWTSSARLAIEGGSNGGLLIGAVLNQRPDLFGAALPEVGVMDMLRFHTFTIGWAWVSEYGSSGDEKMFPVLRAYSPLHTIRPGVAYPPTLVTTADHDDRVVPGHSFKYAAALQAGQGGAAPILIRIQTRAGHGAGKPTGKQIDEATDRLAFLTRALNLPAPVF